MGLLRRFALLGFLLMLAPTPLWAESSTLYVWSDSLTLYAAPSFEAAKLGELSYGTAVEPLGPPGPLVAGRETYPPVRFETGRLFRLHGHWQRLRSRTPPVQEGYAFDTYLVPLPTPRCEVGRSSCDPVTTLGWQSCPDRATVCESIETYSARIFQILWLKGPSHPEASKTSAEVDRRYGQDVSIVYAAAFEGELQSKIWTLPMLGSIDQAYVVMRRFFGSCLYLYTYEPPREVLLSVCGGSSGATETLSMKGKSAVIDWGFMD